MRYIVPTIYGDATMVSKRHGLDLYMPSNNDNYLLEAAIQQQPLVNAVEHQKSIITGINSYQPNSQDKNDIKCAYFCIGTGAHTTVPRNNPAIPAPGQQQGPGALDVSSYLQPIPHSTIDAGPYYWVPFQLRPENNDLAGAERNKYVMRRLVKIGNDYYIGYWIKKLWPSAGQMTGVTPDLSTYTVTNGVTDTGSNSAYVPQPEDMTPSRQRALNSVGQIPTTGRYFSTGVGMSIQFTPDEVNQLRNVGLLLFNDPNALVLSEIGLVYGLERDAYQYYPLHDSPSAIGPSGGSTELVAAHVGTWFSTVKQLGENSDVTIDLTSGATEPEFFIS